MRPDYRVVIRASFMEDYAMIIVTRDAISLLEILEERQHQLILLKRDIGMTTPRIEAQLMETERLIELVRRGITTG
jgi:hypothetical protein